MHFSIIVIFLAGIISCAGKNENKSSTSSTTVIATYDTSKYAIFPFDEKQTWLFKNAKPATLATADFQSIESLLADAIQQYNKKATGQYQVKPLEKYKRQLVPVINENGEKEVWVNCFCFWERSDWRKELVSVDGGGSCFFDIKINLSQKKSYNMMVNGPI